MPIVLTEIENGNGIALTCSGVVTGQDIIETSMVLLSMGERVRNWHFCVVDHTAVRSVDYYPEDLKVTADLDHAIALNTRDGFLVVIIAPSDEQFGSARVWQGLAAKTGWDTAVVRNREEAEKWIFSTCRKEVHLTRNQCGTLSRTRNADS